jgi:two-component system LytT family sensor kinase
VTHGLILNAWLSARVVGYTISTLIVILLFALVRRAARFNDTRPYRLLLWSVVSWNAANLAAAILVLAGFPSGRAAVPVLMAIAYTGAAFAPAGALIAWRPATPGSAQAAGMCAWLVRLSIAAGVLMALVPWEGLLRNPPLVSDRAFSLALAAHVSVFFAAGAVAFYRHQLTSRAGRVAIMITVLGALVVGITAWLKALRPETAAASAALSLGGQFATHAMTLGAMCYFARFRLADVFIRHSLRMIGAAAIGMASMIVLASPVLSGIGIAGVQARAVVMTVGALLIAAVILSFALVDRLIVLVVDRGLFRQPDYDAVRDRLRHTLASERDEAALYAATAGVVRQTLVPADACVVPAGQLAPGVLEALMHTDVIEDSGSGMAGDTRHHPRAIVAAIRAGGTITGALSVTPRSDNPTLLSREVQFVTAAATVLGHRLDLVTREREAIERQTREAMLQQQLSDATLRALQAQINPHFLFNTLNTIAQLIHEEPGRAEAMTLRLAAIFAHVLMRSHRPLSSVGEEMDFLRSYLTIEEARFGDRLSVAFTIDPQAEGLTIPSLILQPAVENALKHGLARTINRGHVTISAAVEGACLRLSVEDNGVGPGAVVPNGVLYKDGVLRPGVTGDTPQPHGGGIGLRNIAERLHTMYSDQASLHFGPRSSGGSVVTIRIPLHEHDQKPAR